MANAERNSCWFFHDWTKFSDPLHVQGVEGGEGMAQKRTCKRCNAVNYRRVLITNIG
jgi:hypothetical protein